MVQINFIVIAFTLVIVVTQFSTTSSTCVLESDFGFKLNCAFKQSGLFRVRNLGGVKGYVGLGLSVGDELGFSQSLSNVEGNKRRSASVGELAIAAAEAEKRGDARAVGVPPFKQMHPKMPVLRSDPPSRPNAVPPFQALPPVVARMSPVPPSVNKLSGVRAQTAFRNAIKTVNHQFIKPQPVLHQAQEKSGVADNELITRTLASKSPEQQLAVVDAALEKNIAALAQASNLSVDAIKAALGDKNNKQQLQQAAAAVALLSSTTARTTSISTTKLTTTTTTPRAPTLPPRPRPQRISQASVGRVMNAPKEYYPVSYDKNFDDGFKTKVDLPPTSFACGDQKHFPGLYADEDLGCMVFHVCALTDDGLIQKSFLCPENTLFDQSVLKCNWWFYVDCPASRRLYDANIPVSKSYQLMKALSFFSAYNKS